MPIKHADPLVVGMGVVVRCRYHSKYWLINVDWPFLDLSVSFTIHGHLGHLVYPAAKKFDLATIWVVWDSPISIESDMCVCPQVSYIISVVLHVMDWLFTCGISVILHANHHPDTPCVAYQHLPTR